MIGSTLPGIVPAVGRNCALRLVMGIIVPAIATVLVQGDMGYRSTMLSK